MDIMENIPEKIADNAPVLDFQHALALLLKALFQNQPPPEMKITGTPPTSALKCLFFYYCRNAFAPETANELRLVYQQFVAAEMRRLAALKKVQSILSEAGTAFFPVKGSLLAYDYYPDPTLRYSVDLDLLVPEEDVGRAFQLIAANGWKPLHDFADFENKHLPELINRRLCTVEIHKHLFNKLPGENRKLIDILRHDPASPELHLAHLMYHAFYQHNWANAAKTVVDVGMILRKREIDPEKYRRIASEFQVENLLESVLASFPEFYPVSWRTMLPARNLTPGIREAIRTVALHSEELFAGRSESEVAFIADHAARYSSQIVGGRLRQLSPTVLGITYDISRSRAYLLYPWYFIHYICTRFFTFLKLRKNSGDPHSARLRQIYKDLAGLKKQM